MAFRPREPSMLQKCLAEFIGTFLLVLTVGCNVLGTSGVWGGLSIASVLMVCIYALGGISGANFNPAVSFALAVSQSMGGPGIEWKHAAKYAATQAAAGLSAAVLYASIIGGTFNLEQEEGFGWLNAALVELLYTCMLCFVVLNVAAAKKNAQEKNQYYGLAIGFVIIAGAYGAGAISGGCFNPAVALGIDLSSIASGFGNAFIWIVFEFIGAALAVFMFKAVRPEDFNKASTGREVVFSEFIGTFFLVLTVGLNVLGKSKAGALSIGAALTSMIYALGDVSGAHFNPAVTVAIFASRRCPELEPAKYIAAQLAGGICGAFLYSMIYLNQAFALGPVKESTWAQACTAEFVFTFLLCYVVLCVACSARTKSSHMFGLAIGACVICGGNAIGGISGGSLNPAVSFGIGATAATHIHGAKVLLAPLIYSGVEAAAGAAAAVTFKITHDVDILSAKGF